MNGWHEKGHISGEVWRPAKAIGFWFSTEPPPILASQGLPGPTHPMAKPLTSKRLISKLKLLFWYFSVLCRCLWMCLWNHLSYHIYSKCPCYSVMHIYSKRGCIKSNDVLCIVYFSNAMSIEKSIWKRWMCALDDLGLDFERWLQYSVQAFMCLCYVWVGRRRWGGNIIA